MFWVKTALIPIVFFPNKILHSALFSNGPRGDLIPEHSFKFSVTAERTTVLCLYQHDKNSLVQNSCGTFLLSQSDWFLIRIQDMIFSVLAAPLWKDTFTGSAFYLSSAWMHSHIYTYIYIFLIFAKCHANTMSKPQFGHYLLPRKLCLTSCPIASLLIFSFMMNLHCDLPKHPRWSWRRARHGQPWELAGVARSLSCRGQFLASSWRASLRRWPLLPNHD